MRITVAIITAVAALVAAPAAQANPAQSPVVRRWIDTTLGEIATHATNPPRASRALAHVSHAMY